jgi:hypothetical protein
VNTSSPAARPALIVTVDTAGDVPLIRVQEANGAGAAKTASLSTNESSVAIAWIESWLRQAVEDAVARGQATCRGADAD